MPRTEKSQISFADWELLQQGISLDPLLQGISEFLEDHEEMIDAVRRDLAEAISTVSAQIGAVAILVRCDSNEA